MAQNRRKRPPKRRYGSKRRIRGRGREPPAELCEFNGLLDISQRASAKGQKRPLCLGRAMPRLHFQRAVRRLAIQATCTPLANRSANWPEFGHPWAGEVALWRRCRAGAGC